MAAAYLLSQGANLNMVSDMVTRELTPEQVSLLNDMIEAVTHRNINGVDVAITSVSREAYVADFALLAHKLKDMQNLDVVFALASMENRIYMVGRSRLPEVDVGEIAMAFDGGGHPSAASATIRGQTIIQVEEKLNRLLNQFINPNGPPGSALVSCYPRGAGRDTQGSWTIAHPLQCECLIVLESENCSALSRGKLLKRASTTNLSRSRFGST